jgi:uncharacterized protein YjbJ (UPF0337 family)
MNSQIFEGKIKEISGQLRQKWGALTDDEIQKTKGNIEELSGLVSQKVGISKEEAQKQVGQFMDDMEHKYSASFTEKLEATEKNLASKVNEKIDQIKNKFSH